MQSVKLISLDDNNVRVYKIAKSLKEKNYNVEIIMLERKKISNEVYHDEIINEISVKRFYCRKFTWGFIWGVILFLVIKCYS